MVYPLFDALQVQHDHARSFMRFQWRDPGNQHLRPALVYGRDIVVSHKPRYVLVDFTGLPPLSVQDELWMSVSWLPIIAAQPIQCVAVVLPRDDLHNQMAVETLLWLGRHLLRFQLQVFEDVRAALDWITDADTTWAQHLQAEWEAGPTPIADADVLPT